MVIALIGESCTGKTTLAKALLEKRPGTLYSGKDYLRMAKSGEEGRRRFGELLKAHEDGGELILYVLGEQDQLALLPPKAVRVLVTAGLDAIRRRFAARMGGHLPPAVSMMLEKKHGQFDREPHDLRVKSGEEDAEAVCQRILDLLAAREAGA